MKETILGYEIERKKIKNINMRIREDMSIYISAPMNIDSYYIEQFIISKKEWIDKNIKRLESIKEHYKEPKYDDGSVLRYLNREIKMSLEIATYDNVKLINDLLVVKSKSNDIEYKKNLINKWYYDNAKKIFVEYMNKWLNIMGENISKLTIKPIKGKWATCNTYTRSIVLNTELIKRSEVEIEYVIIHEISHLNHPNHSTNFYKQVEKYMPDYKKAVKMLSYGYRN